MPNEELALKESWEDVISTFCALIYPLTQDEHDDFEVSLYLPDGVRHASDLRNELVDYLKEYQPSHSSNKPFVKTIELILHDLENVIPKKKKKENKYSFQPVQVSGNESLYTTNYPVHLHNWDH